MLRLDRRASVDGLFLDLGMMRMLCPFGTVYASANEPASESHKLNLNLQGSRAKTAKLAPIEKLDTHHNSQMTRRCDVKQQPGIIIMMGSRCASARGKRNYFSPLALWHLTRVEEMSSHVQSVLLKHLPPPPRTPPALQETLQSVKRCTVWLLGGFYLARLV